MYWSDLSRPRSGVLYLAGAFYQLVFHVGSLALRAIDAASLEHCGSRLWKWYSRTQLWASLTLQLLLAMFYPCLFGLILVLIAVAGFNTLHVGVARTALVTVVGLSAFPVLLSFGISRARGTVSPPAVWSSLLVGGAALGAALALTRRFDDIASPQAAAVIAALVVAAVAAPLVSKYRRVRPMAQLFALTFGAAAFLGLSLALLHYPADGHGALLACLATIQAAYDVWAYLLTLMLVLQSVCWAVGLWAVFRAPFTSEEVTRTQGADAGRRAEARERAARAYKTACLAQTLPIILLTFITTAAVAGLGLLTKPLLGDTRYTPPFKWTLLIPDWKLHANGQPSVNAYEFLGELHHHLITPQLIMMLAAVGVATALTLWAMWPLVWYEVRPPAPAVPPTAAPGRSVSQARASAAAMTALSRGWEAGSRSPCINGGRFASAARWSSTPSSRSSSRSSSCGSRKPRIAGAWISSPTECSTKRILKPSSSR